MSVLHIYFKLAFNKKYLWLCGTIVGIFFSAVVFGLSFYGYYRQLIYQNIYIDQVNVGGLTKAEAYEKVNQHTKKDKPPPLRLTITAEDQAQTFHQQNLTFKQISKGKDVEQAVEDAFAIGRQDHLLQNILVILSLLKSEENIAVNYKFNHLVLADSLEKLKEEVDFIGEPHHFSLVESNNAQSIQFNQGVDGRELLVDESVQKILQILEERINQAPAEQATYSILAQAVVEPINHQLTEEEIEASKNRIEKFVGTSIEFYGYDQAEYENTTEIKAKVEKANETTAAEPPAGWLMQQTLNDQQLVDLLTWPSGIDDAAIEQTIVNWAEAIDRPAVNAEFDYDPDTMQATKFKPGQTSLKIDQQEIKQALINFITYIDKVAAEKLTADEVSKVSEAPTDKLSAEEGGEAFNDDLSARKFKIVYLLLEQAEPDLKLADTNDLGINELIGVGDSYYYGSIAPRLHNIEVASEKLNHTIIPPGEKFYFNQTVGEVNHAAGFEPAYVIRSGRTLLEFGGGVCQVSTTTFRALLDAGANITRRLPHSYRVSYYEYHNKPGFDATVYSGNVDLRFENDTPGHILIIAEADSQQAYMSVKLYGTDDGRKTEIKNYQQWGYQAPPPPQEIPDESLAPGERRQVENAIPGLKTSFDWVVTSAEGEIIHKKTFYSNYQAWGEKWLVGI